MSPSTRDVLSLSCFRSIFTANGVEDINSHVPTPLYVQTARPQQRGTPVIGNAYHSLCIRRSIAWGKGWWGGLHQEGARSELKGQDQS